MKLFVAVMVGIFVAVVYAFAFAMCYVAGRADDEAARMFELMKERDGDSGRFVDR